MTLRIVLTATLLVGGAILWAGCQDQSSERGRNATKHDTGKTAPITLSFAWEHEEGSPIYVGEQIDGQWHAIDVMTDARFANGHWDITNISPSPIVVSKVRFTPESQPDEVDRWYPADVDKLPFTLRSGETLQAFEVPLRRKTMTIALVTNRGKVVYSVLNRRMSVAP